MAVRIGLVCATALAAAGCSNNSLFDADSYSGMFSKPLRVFDTPEWAAAVGRKDDIRLGPSGPVAPEDLVGADGRCAAEATAAPAQGATTTAADRAAEPSPPPADRAVGSVAGDLAGAPMAAGSAPAAAAPTASAPPPDRLEPETQGAPPTPAVAGGIALGMTECQVVRRAGTPNSVTVGADDKGERKVVITYAGGNWPGVYHFQSGRLKEIEAVPTPEKPAKPATKKPKAKGTKAAKGAVTRLYVQ
ncbi:MAG: hypothetical protein IRY89_10470 [Pseudolabrys sp.]|nr:hypothetical protein [Pseudolabrys sp.]